MSDHKVLPAFYLTAEEWAKWTTPNIDDDFNRSLLESTGVGTESYGCYGMDAHSTAALALHNKPFGFTWQDVDDVRAMRESYAATMDNFRAIVRTAIQGKEYSASDNFDDALARFASLADRIAALLPPRNESA